jgi:hypothetical protein
MIMWQDIQKDIMLGRLSQWMKHRCIAAQFSTERGTAEEHLHIQGIAALNMPEFATSTGMSVSLNR